MPQQGKSQQTLRNNAWSDVHLQVSDPGCRPLMEWRIWSHNVGPGTSLSCWVTQPGIRNSHCSVICVLEGLNLSKLQLDTVWENPASHLNIWDERMPACLHIMLS